MSQTVCTVMNEVLKWKNSKEQSCSSEDWLTHTYTRYIGTKISFSSHTLQLMWRHTPETALNFNSESYFFPFFPQHISKQTNKQKIQLRCTYWHQTRLYQLIKVVDCPSTQLLMWYNTPNTDSVWRDQEQNSIMRTTWIIPNLPRWEFGGQHMQNMTSALYNPLKSGFHLNLQC